MKWLFHRWRWLLAGAVLSLALLALGAQWWGSSQFSREKIIAFLERRHNCRASLESAQLSLWNSPTFIEITGLKLLPRGEAPLTPLHDRTESGIADTMIALDRVRLETSLWSALSGSLKVSRVLIDRPDVRGQRSKKGENSLQKLLGKPPKDSAASAPEVTPPPVTPPQDPSAPFNISELPYAVDLERLIIRKGTFLMRNDKKRTYQEARDLDFEITGLCLHPGDLSKQKPAALSASAHIVVDNQKLNVRTVDFLIELAGSALLFDAQSGVFQDDLDFTLTMKKGSTINRIPTLEKLAVRLEGMKKKLGLDIGLQPDGVLTKDLTIKSKLQDGMIRFTEDLLFPFDTYRIRVDSGSWMSLKDDDHEFHGKLLASDAISKKTFDGVSAFLEDKSPALQSAGQVILEKLRTDSGNLSVPFLSNAEIGDPEVSLSKKFEDSIKGLVLKAGTDLILDTVKGGDGLQQGLEILQELKKGKSQQE